MRAPHISEIEAGIVTLPFFTRGEYVRRGTILSRDVLAKMPINNRNALIDKGYISPVLKASRAALDAAADMRRYVVGRGRGQFDVVEGRVITDAPVSKDIAYKMAGIPMPDQPQEAAR